MSLNMDILGLLVLGMLVSRSEIGSYKNTFDTHRMSHMTRQYKNHDRNSGRWRD